MKEEYKELLEEAQLERKTYTKILDKLRRHRIKDLDYRVQSADEEVFEEIDCLECGNCCLNLGPRFNETDINRISKHFGMKAVPFKKQYLELDEDNDWVLSALPCPFLDQDTLECEIYDIRPRACGEYPHTGYKNFKGHIGVTKKNLDICPALGPILKKVDDSLS